MFAVVYYTLFLLAILAPVGAYCYRVEQFPKFRIGVEVCKPWTHDPSRGIPLG